MEKICRPAADIAVVTALLSSGIAVGLPIDTARGEDSCVSVPSGTAPAGQHWYYRTDQVKHRKCWYLHATVPLPNHAAAEHHAAPLQPLASVAAPQSPFGMTPQATNAAPEPQPADSNSNSPSEAASAKPAPHVTVLTVKTVTAPVIDTTSASQAATPEQAGEPPMQQISPRNANVPMEGDAKSASGPDPAIIPAASDTPQNALAPAHTEAIGSARTQSAHLLFLLALAPGGAAALMALVIKMIDQARAPRLSDHPDDAWRRYRTAHRGTDEAVAHEEDTPFLAPQQPPHGLAELDALERIKQSAAAQTDFSAVPPQRAEPGQSEQVGLKDTKLALRVLRQERRSIT